jgi:hypothetical protein
VTSRNGVRVIDDKGDEYEFPLAPTLDKKGMATGGRSYTIEARPYEEGDPKKSWRVALHPWDGGLRQGRIDVAVSGYTGQFFNKTPRTYAKGNCDASYPGLLLFPPLQNALTLTNGNANPPKILEFDSLLFILCGRYMYTYDPATNTVAEDKDFGAAKTCVDAAVFNSELVVAMGETEKIWTRNTSDVWTQATNNTFAIALGVVDNKLWRAESTNKISSCTTAPRTLTSWTPASPNQYTCGESTFAVNTIIDYGGVPWIGKGDGMYAPDPQYRFKCQTPQIKRYPHTDNCKGAFVAQGYLWVPSAAGLIRVKPGESKPRGPELSGRPDYHWWARAGIEWGDSIYLACTDEADTEESCIVKMTRDEQGVSDNEYVYHEWRRIGSANNIKAIAISTLGTNPKMVYGNGNNARYIILGRGPTRMVDDANYSYGTSMSLETGPVVPTDDMTRVSTLLGVSTLLNYSDEDEFLSVQFRKDGESTYLDMADSYDEAGSVVKINKTDRYEVVRRYAPPNTQGQYFEFKLTATQAGAAGTTRPEIREMWAWGYSHPRLTDFVTIAMPTGRNVRMNGKVSGNTRSRALNLFRRWMNDGIELEVKLPDYEETKPTRFLVREVAETEVDATLGAAYGSDTSGLLKVLLVRADHSGGYAE